MVTIVVPIHNRAALLAETLRSIARQSYRPLAVVLVDDHSTDGALDVARRWAQEVRADDFTVEVAESFDRGACAARNFGLGRVTTPYTMFFDSDDYMPPTHVATAVRAIEGYDLAYWREIQRSSPTRQVVSPKPTADPIISNLLYGTLSTHRFIARTELLRRAGGWNEALPRWNDLDLGTRLLINTAQTRYVDLHLREMPIIRCHADSITGTRRSANVGEWERALDAIEEALREAGLSRYVRWVDVRRVDLAGTYRREGARAAAKTLMDATLRNADPDPFYLARLRALYLKASLIGKGTLHLSRLLL